MLGLLPRGMRRTYCILQEEPGKSATVDSESNNEDDASDLLDVRVWFSFNASSYGSSGTVTIEHTRSLIQL